jgi:23S rRNA (guanine745-N1)-methyltransferase
MSLWWEKLLACPICQQPLHREEGSLACSGARRHAFDLASAGYVNLSPAKAAGGGDDSTLIHARTAFLTEGHYAPIAARVAEILQDYCPNGTVLDAGCGEGYYTAELARRGFSMLGVDLSKKGILHAAKVAKREQLSAFYAVAGVFELPLADASADAVISLFAPVAEQEFLRVLKPGGHLVLVGAGERHLYSLKEVLYDTPYLNQARADAPTQMQLVKSERLTYQTEVAGESLQALFSMTPYFYRTPKAGVERLRATPQLSVDVDVELHVYKK